MMILRHRTLNDEANKKKRKQKSKVFDPETKCFEIFLKIVKILSLNKTCRKGRVFFAKKKFAFRFQK